MPSLTFDFVSRTDLSHKKRRKKKEGLFNCQELKQEAFSQEGRTVDIKEMSLFITFS